MRATNADASPGRDAITYAAPRRNTYTNRHTYSYAYGNRRRNTFADSDLLTRLVGRC